MSRKSYIHETEFLPVGSTLMAKVKLPDQIDSALRTQVDEHSRREGFLRIGHGVPILLKEPLRIRFSISTTWNVSRDLLPCKCDICLDRVDRDLTVESVNSAFQKVSEILEADRRSHGGTVYEGIYYRDSGERWQPLGIRREELYDPYRQRYEDAVRKYKEGTPSLLRPADSLSELVVANSAQILAILRQNENKEDYAGLVQSLRRLYQNTSVALYRSKIKEFEERLSARYEYSESDWQDWIYKNSWMFAAQYGAPFPKERVAFDKIPDFLFPTLDGYIDALEIKTPSAPILIEDTSHSRSFRWSQEASSAISQVTLYLEEIEANRATIIQRIEEKYSVTVGVLRPRGIILIGHTAGWKRAMSDSLRRLNDGLHGIEIISYTHLLQRAQGLVSLFEEDLRRET